MPCSRNCEPCDINCSALVARAVIYNLQLSALRHSRPPAYSPHHLPYRRRLREIALRSIRHGQVLEGRLRALKIEKRALARLPKYKRWSARTGAMGRRQFAPPLPSRENPKGCSFQAAERAAPPVAPFKHAAGECGIVERR